MKVGFKSGIGHVETLKKKYSFFYILRKRRFAFLPKKKINPIFTIKENSCQNEYGWLCIIENHGIINEKMIAEGELFEETPPFFSLSIVVFIFIHLFNKDGVSFWFSCSNFFIKEKIAWFIINVFISIQLPVFRSLHFFKCVFDSA